MDLIIIDCRDFWQANFKEKKNVEWGNHMDGDLFDHILIVYGVSWYISAISLGLYDVYCNDDVIAIIKLRKYTQNFKLMFMAASIWDPCFLGY